ncbi:hypothetical protein FHR24_000407 [Wenyingzhuangia heitensis]|uniref:Por secretion system C-terminal sorting domain-containing protein n=1 Tax=Wenyingzhuangia heitensis TaxID=1487859 RepID=A0ABX0U706_9FLAO|nr:hypothetical protein [Wenyingzhuangia heitensis]NIJ43968.1 hypothetical protein [Wenyingzhuangia heitensis]
MKKIIQFLVFVCSSFIYAQSSGDILFIGFNADGEKDLAIVVLKDLGANTIIYFTDSEPNISGDGNSDTEGILRWDTGLSLIPAGTVVVFTDVDSASNPSFGSSIGNLTVTDAGFNIATSGDAVYATYGDPGNNMVTTWIAGIQNNNEGLEANFSATGLSITSNFVVIDNTASKDGGAYSGVRTNKTVSEYKTLIVDEENWTTMTDSTDDLLPFNSTSFTFPTLGLNNLTSNKVIFSNVSGQIVVNKGNVVDIINLMGQKVHNIHLVSGVYFVTVNINDVVVRYKVFM